MNFNENVKRLRIERGMTQDELAKKVGYNDRSSIAKLETGASDIPYNKILLMAEALGVEPIELFGFNDEEEEKNEVITLFERLNAAQKEAFLNLLRTTVGADNQ